MSKRHPCLHQQKTSIANTAGGNKAAVTITTHTRKGTAYPINFTTRTGTTPIAKASRNSPGIFHAKSAPFPSVTTTRLHSSLESKPSPQLNHLNTTTANLQPPHTSNAAGHNLHHEGPDFEQPSLLAARPGSPEANSHPSTTGAAKGHNPKANQNKTLNISPSITSNLSSLPSPHTRHTALWPQREARSTPMEPS
ncbi:Hypothetical protein PYTT_0288 [Akkermansia glycaniphila]|uniref:Uncharacterized protein n=1 Tax=Akkermansia glycaniphila TaxID=1679444 RepID=A0A1H6KN96_9BACT|nr:Hypothetical protein PYTT_0288 [Akkermansia glycaniphila]